MRIKQIPEDFIVEELIDIKASDKGDNIYFWLKKKNWTTDAAVRAVAKACNASSRRFRFAGTKDRAAITKQAVSGFKISKKSIKNVKIKDIDVDFIDFGDKPISIGSLRGNRFEIVVRDLDKDDIEKLNNNLPKLRQKGFPNLFGEQRFGRGNTHLIGKAIIQGYLQDAVKEMLCTRGSNESDEATGFRELASGNWKEWRILLKNIPKQLGLEKMVLEKLVKSKNDFAGALMALPKHIRKLYVHAYQSWLWNNAFDFESDKDMFPIPGFKTRLRDDKFSENIKQLLKQDNICLDDFRCNRMPGLALEGDERKAFVVPENLDIKKLEDDELNKDKLKVKISFELPKGCYATELIKFLFH